MTIRPLSGIAVAAFVLTGSLAVSQTAKAEDLVDFLWGGSEEFGGGRQVTSFSPEYKPGQIIVSFSDRRLYLITAPGKAITYPVAVPTGEARWQGVTVVSNKKINPAWTPTPEMVRNNPRLPRWVPGGHPMNPLGVRGLYLGSSAYRIHGTDAPWTIGQAVSHGCIRMTNKDVLDLYPRVPIGTRVTVTWQTFSSHPVASNEPVFGDEKQIQPAAASGYGAQASYASYSADAQSDTQSDDDYERARPTSARDRAPGLSMWDDEDRQPRSEKKKASKESQAKKVKSETGAEVASVTKASTGDNRDEPAITKSATASEEKHKAEKADTHKSSAAASEPDSAKPVHAKIEKPAASAKSPAAEHTASPNSEKKADAAEAKQASATHDAKTVIKNYKAVSDPVAIKKSVGDAEKSVAGKSDKTASAQ